MPPTVKVSNSELMAKLFRWSTKVDVHGTTFYIRVVGDSVIDDARRLSLLEARKLRKSLRDPNTDNYLLYLDAFEEFSKDELIEYIITASSREMAREYLSENPRPSLPELSENPSQEELEEYEAAKSARDEMYLTTMQESILVWQRQNQENLSKIEEDKLRSMARRYKIDEVAEQEFNRLFESYVVAASVYVDDKYTQPAFPDFTVYMDLPNDIKQIFYDGYNNMSISSDEIKNS